MLVVLVLFVLQCMARPHLVLPFLLHLLDWSNSSHKCISISASSDVHVSVPLRVRAGPDRQDIAIDQKVIPRFVVVTSIQTR